MKKNILLKNGFLIDGTGKEGIDNTFIEINKGIVVSICKVNPNFEYDQIIDLNGLTILPGFISIGLSDDNLNKSGLTNMQIIVEATKQGSLISLEDEIGTIEVGKKANLIIVEGNPIENLDCIKDVKLVIKNGVPIVNKLVNYTKFIYVR